MCKDGFYENKYKHHEQQCHDDERIVMENRLYMDENNHSQKGYDKSIYLNNVIDKVKNSRKLKILVGIMCICLLAILITIIIILILVIAKLINFISQNGIQGVIDSISGFLNKIWKGAGK
jgi:hypothetical protein